MQISSFSRGSIAALTVGALLMAAGGLVQAHEPDPTPAKIKVEFRLLESSLPDNLEVTLESLTYTIDQKGLLTPRPSRTNQPAGLVRINVTEKQTSTAPERKPLY